MDWSAGLSAIAGTLAGIAATYLVDRDRWKRTRQADTQHVLRDAFVAYLAHLATATENMRFAAEAHQDPDERRRAVRGAFGQSELFQQRYQLTLLAPPRVVELGVQAFRSVRTLRHLLADGAEITSDVYQAAQHTYFETVTATATAMRSELGIPGRPFTPLARSHDHGQQYS